MAELAQILERTISQNSAEQLAALNLLNEASQSNFPEFIRQLALVLADPKHSPFVRKQAGLQIKNALVAREQALFDQKRNRWFSTPDEIRRSVKECVLRTLGTEVRPSVAAQCIAAIACMELPSNQWPELVDQLSANVTSTSGPETAALREASLEALGYLGLDMPEKQKVGPVLAAIVRGMQANEGSVHVRLAATRALSEIVDWVVTRTLDEHVDAIVDAASAYLQTAELNLYEEAAKCLWKIASRKCSKTAETSIVVSLFRDGPMTQILTAANLAAQVSSSSYEHYKYLKALCDLLCALGLHLADVWSYKMLVPPNFSMYLRALSAFFLHPSIYIRAETAQVLATFYAHEYISKNKDFLDTIPPLIQLLPKAMNKSFCPAASTSDQHQQQQDMTFQYSQMDYETELEEQREYVRLRDHCLRIVRECAQDHFDKLMAVCRDWVGCRCVPSPENVPLDEWEVMKRLITAVLQTSYALELATPEVRKEYLAYFDAALSVSVRVFSTRTPTKAQQQLFNGVLSILSALFPVFDDYPERIPTVLEHFKSILIVDNARQDMDIMATKRHVIALILKMVSSFPQPIKPYGRTVLDLVHAVSPFVSMMQRANLVPILAALSNLAESVDVQAGFLRASIQPDIDYIAGGQQFSASPADFLAHSGLTNVPDAVAVANQQCPFYQNRLTLKAHLSALEGVLNQIEVPQDDDGSSSTTIFDLFRPVIPKFFQFSECLNALYEPRNTALIHPFYGTSVLDMGPSEKLTIVSSLNLEGMETEFGGRKADAEYESSQASSISAANGAISAADSAVFMRRFISEITDLSQSIIGLVCARFQRNFYAIPGATEAIERIHTAIEFVPNFRIRFWIRRAWGRIVCSCPVRHHQVVLPFLKRATSHMQTRLVEQWELLKRKQTASSDEDTEPTEEEMIAESTMSLLSRECAIFVTAFIAGDSFASKNAKGGRDAASISPIAQALFADRELFLAMLGLLAKLITCPDSQAVVKCVPVLNLFVANYHQSIDEQTAAPLLIHAIQSLQLYLSDEMAAGPILTLIFNLYAALRPRHPALLDVLRQVPNCQPENLEQFDQRIMTIHQQQQQNGGGSVVEEGNGANKLHDKLKRDQMRRVLISTKVKVHHHQNNNRKESADDIGGGIEEGEME